MNSSSALRVAIGLHLMPAQSPKIKQALLPKDIDILLLVAIGNEEATNKALKEIHHPKETIQSAAVYFIENILLSPDADSYRILGNNPDATGEELRKNMALMIRYLHPDIRQNKDPLLITRVTNAWNDLKTTEKRGAYDRQHHQKAKPKVRSYNKRKKTTSQKKRKAASKHHFSYRKQWRGLFLRQLTLFLMKISGRR